MPCLFVMAQRRHSGEGSQLALRPCLVVLPPPSPITSGDVTLSRFSLQPLPWLNCSWGTTRCSPLPALQLFPSCHCSGLQPDLFSISEERSPTSFPLSLWGNIPHITINNTASYSSGYLISPSLFLLTQRKPMRPQVSN